MTGSFLQYALIYLCAGVFAVPLASRLGLGSVLGYLGAGIVIGPLLHLVDDNNAQVQHFAEFGVVMMLFLIGLELQPRKLWEMRDRLLGLGGLQVVLTSAAGMGAAMLLGQPWQPALAIGMILSVSSTAIVLQTLAEKGWLKTEGGQSSFAILLFQDIAVIPILALLPLLATMPAAAPAAADAAAHGGQGAWIESLAPSVRALVVLAAVGSVVVFGRYLTRPVFRGIAGSGLSEIFTAAALLLVVAIASLMTLVGLSPALGAFVAGVVLADSEFRHELESDIAPFKGLLLGLFFVTVGAGIQFSVLLGAPFTVLGLALGLMLLKFAILWLLGRLFRLPRLDRWMAAMGLAQGGEFAFVLIAFAAGAQVLAPAQVPLLSLIVALSMLLTPAVFILYDRVVAPALAGGRVEREADTIDETGTAVIAGMGRFGQIVNRMLTSQGFSSVVLDHAADQIENLARFGQKGFYGDASRPELLRAAGIAEAKVFVSAIDDRERSVAMVRHVKQQYPQVKIIARAFDRVHVYELRNAGADVVVREVFAGSLDAAEHALRALGLHPFRAHRARQAFRVHDEASLEHLYGFWDSEKASVDNPTYVAQARQRQQALLETMRQDRAGRRGAAGERAWTPPPSDLGVEQAPAAAERAGGGPAS